MLYLNHDFYSNFNSGVESGDNDLITDLLVNEISELLVYREEKLLSLLNSVEIETSEKATDEKIVDNILNNIPENIKLCKGLAFLIAENNKVAAPSKMIVEKDGKKKRVPTKKSATVKDIDAIASGIIGIGDSFEHKPQLKKELKLKLMKVIDTKSKAVGDRTRKHTSNQNGKYVLLGILVVLAGVGVYFYLKHKKKVAAEGMDTGSPEPIIVPPPAPEVPPTPVPTPEVVAPAPGPEVAPVVETPVA